jgi:hypothetical protein
MMVEILIIAEPDYFILLEVQEDRLRLPLLCHSAVRPESRDDRRVADSS